MILEQPYIGLKLKDHPVIRLGATVEQDATHDIPLAATKDDVVAAAQGYLKLDPSTLSALSSLDTKVQSHLVNDRTPTHEILLVLPPFFPSQSSYVCPTADFCSSSLAHCS